MSSATKQEALSYLAGHQVMTLATTGPLGVWAAAVFYVNEGFDLFFLSAGHTRHAQNLAESPRAAGTIQEDYREWTAVQGIQLEGAVQRLQGAERDKAIDIFQAKYVFLNQAPPVIQTAFAAVNWYRLRPDKLYFVDNSKGFGWRDQII